MDSFTQIALGACIGQAIGYRKFGIKALVFGGLGGLIPDLDVITTPLTDEFGSWKYHRHITHSLWFGPVLGYLMGWGLWRHYGRQAGHLIPWIAIMGLSLFTHPLLDLFTIYGTQLLAPFSSYRFEISGVSIIDPIYTLTLLLAMALPFSARLRPYAQTLASIALTLTTAYLFYGWYINTKADSLARIQLEKEQIAYQDLDVFTTMFQPYLRRVVVREENQLRVGFVSTFAPSPIIWQCQTQAPFPVRQAILETEEGKLLNWFSGENLSISEVSQKGEIFVTDARYGVPGESLFGWWGLNFKITTDEDGRVHAHYLSYARLEIKKADSELIVNLFRAAYGLPNHFMMTESTGCSSTTP